MRFLTQYFFQSLIISKVIVFYLNNKILKDIYKARAMGIATNTQPTSCNLTTRLLSAHKASTATSCCISRVVSAARRRLRMNLAAYSSPETRWRILRTDANLPLEIDKEE